MSATTYLVAIILLAAPIGSSVWNCERSGSFVFTNRPVRSDKSSCVPADLDQSPYSRVPAEFFEQERKRLDPPTKSSTPNAAISRTIPNERASFSTTWRSEERPAMEGNLSPQCLMRGKAQGKAGKARVRIRRGGATVDEVSITLRARGDTAWETVLRGPCRDAEVTVVRKD